MKDYSSFNVNVKELSMFEDVMKTKNSYEKIINIFSNPLIKNYLNLLIINEINYNRKNDILDDAEKFDFDLSEFIPELYNKNITSDVILYYSAGGGVKVTFNFYDSSDFDENGELDIYEILKFVKIV